MQTRVFLLFFFVGAILTGAHARSVEHNSTEDDHSLEVVKRSVPENLAAPIPDFLPLLRAGSNESDEGTGSNESSEEDSSEEYSCPLLNILFLPLKLGQDILEDMLEVLPF